MDAEREGGLPEIGRAFLIFSNCDRHSPTILGDTACTTAGLVYPCEIRKLSIVEIQALASYPEDFSSLGATG